jgi:predicted dehydrogenase
LPEFFFSTEIVYIGILNETHCRWVCASLGSGKHVLCEKPMGLSLAEAQMIAEKAREKGLFVMEVPMPKIYANLHTKFDSRPSGPDSSL